MIAMISDSIYELGAPVFQDIAESQPYKEMARIARVVKETAIKQLGISGFGTFLKSLNIGCQFVQLSGRVSKSTAFAFMGIRTAAMHAGFFRAVAVLHGTAIRIDEAMGRFFKNIGNSKSMDAIGAFLSAASDITYLFSRVMIILSYLQKYINVIPGLKGVVTALSIPGQVGLLIGGICQVTVSATRLVSYLVPQIVGGRLFDGEGDDKMAATANAVVDLIKLGEGLAWMFEASVMLAACTNPWTMLGAVAVSTAFQVVQIYLIPMLREYYPPAEKQKI